MTKSDLAFHVSQIILEARLSMGLSQKELARRMKTHQPAIARWENGSQLPSIESLMKIAFISKRDLKISL